MTKASNILLILVLIICFSATALADPVLLVGTIDEDFFAGLKFQHTQRKMLGFIGYQTDHFSGSFALTNNGKGLVGYLKTGQEVFVGNIKYELGAHAGNLDFDTNILARNKLGATGKVMQLRGNIGYGVSAEINLVGNLKYKVVPYFQLRNQGIFQIEVGLASFTKGYNPLIGLSYFVDTGGTGTSNLFYYTNLQNEFAYGGKLYLSDDLALSAKVDASNYLSFGINWQSFDYPIGISFSKNKSHTQWLANFRLNF